MLQGTNILQFFSKKENRHYEKDVNTDVMPVFETGYTPAFVLVSDIAIANATVKTLTAVDDTEVASSAVSLVTNADGTVLYFSGSNIGGLNDDCYYLELTTNIGVFYSDVFAWSSNIDELDVVKIEFQTTDLRMSSLYDLPYDGINFYFYLYCNGISIDAEVNEDGVEEPFGVLPVYNVVSIKRIAEINGYNQIFRMLSALRIIGTNGVVQLTDKDSTRYIYETEATVKDSSDFGESMIIEFTFKERDFLATKNEI